MPLYLHPEVVDLPSGPGGAPPAAVGWSSLTTENQAEGLRSRPAPLLSICGVPTKEPAVPGDLPAGAWNLWEPPRNAPAVHPKVPMSLRKDRAMPRNVPAVPRNVRAVRPNVRTGLRNVAEERVNVRAHRRNPRTQARKLGRDARNLGRDRGNVPQDPRSLARKLRNLRADRRHLRGSLRYVRLQLGNELQHGPDDPSTWLVSLSLPGKPLSLVGKALSRAGRPRSPGGVS